MVLVERSQGDVAEVDAGSQKVDPAAPLSPLDPANLDVARGNGAEEMLQQCIDTVERFKHLPLATRQKLDQAARDIGYDDFLDVKVELAEDAVAGVDVIHSAHTTEAAIYSITQLDEWSRPLAVPLMAVTFETEASPPVDPEVKASRQAAITTIMDGLKEMYRESTGGRDIVADSERLKTEQQAQQPPGDAAYDAAVPGLG